MPFHSALHVTLTSFPISLRPAELFCGLGSTVKLQVEVPAAQTAVAVLPARSHRLFAKYLKDVRLERRAWPECGEVRRRSAFLSEPHWHSVDPGRRSAA